MAGLIGLGQLARADGPVVINEIHYNPDVKTQLVEFVELFNRGTNTVNLGGWAFTAGIAYTFPPGSLIPPSNFLVVAKVPAQVAVKYGATNVYGPYTNDLSTSGEALTLRNADGGEEDSVTYQLGFPWPTVGDPPTTNASDVGKGFSIELINPWLDNDMGGSWRSSSNGAARGPTPGRQNVVFATNAPPQIRQVDHAPAQPISGQPVTVTAKITDPEGVASVSLQYQVVTPGAYIELLDAAYNNAANWITVPMADTGLGGDLQAGDDVYTVVISGAEQVHRRLIRYRITVTDSLGASVRVPYADDPCPNFAYFVYDSVPSWQGAIQPGAVGTNGTVMNISGEEMGRLPVYQLVAKKSSVENSTWFTRYAFSEANEAIRSAYQWWGTLVYDGKVYDHIRYRPRGGVWRYAMCKNMWKFDMNRGHDFEARDNYGKKFEIPWSKINFGSSIQQGDFNHRGEQGMFESVGFRLFQLTGLVAANTAFVSFRVIDEAAESYPNNQYEGDFWGVYLAVEDMGGRYLDQHGLPDGNLYKIDWGGKGYLENINPNGPTDGSDLAYIRNNFTSASDAWWRTNWNVADFYNYQAILLAIHHYDINGGKNFYYYRNPETRLWSVLPWDLDLSWAQNMYNTSWGGLNEIATKMFVNPTAVAGTGSQAGTSNVQLNGGRPVFEREFRNRVREIRDLLYNSDQAHKVIDEYAGFLRGTNAITILDADRNMWDYNPKMISSTYTTDPNSKARQGLFYQFPGESGTNAALKGNFSAAVQIMKYYVLRRAEYLDSLAAEAGIPAQPAITYVGANGYPVNRLTFRSGNFSSPVGAGFASLRWRIGEISDYTIPIGVGAPRRKYEIEAVWDSGPLSNFLAEATIPAQFVEAGRKYRARVQHVDALGRASNWSAPVEFVTAPADNTLELVNSLRITELMYHPPVGGSEYIELYNTGSTVLDLSGVEFNQGIEYTFPPGVTLAPSAYLVLANTADLASFRAFYNVPPAVAVLGPFTRGSLNNAGEQLTLRTPSGTTNIVSFTYGTGREWPLAADGAGHSLVPLDAALASQTQAGEYGPNWRASTYLKGSAGRADLPPPTGILLNEITANTGTDSNDWIELFNPTDNPITLGAGWYLSDAATNLAKWMVPAGTLIPARGWVSFDEKTGFHNPTNTGFGISSDGEQVFLAYLAGGVDDRVVDVARFKAQEPGWSWGRYPDGAAWWQPLVPLTRNAANGVAPPGVVLAEIHYHPPDIDGTNDNGFDEFLEIKNTSAQPAALFNATGPWRINGEIELVLPPGLTLAPGATLLVLNFDPAVTPDWERFCAAHDVPVNTLAAGPYANKLPNSSGRVAVERPQAGALPGEVAWVLVDEVFYSDFSPWPCATDGQGNSLQRVNLAGPGNDPYNWMAQFPTPGRDRPPVPPGVAAFLTQPAPRVVPTNANVVFTVSLCGQPPYAYQWYFNGGPLAGQTNATLSLSSVQLLASGNYAVTVSNAAGLATSAVASLIVQTPPGIAQHPQSLVATGYTTVSFSVEPAGIPPFQYQWQYNGADLPAGTNQTLVLTDVRETQAGRYRVLVSNSAGSIPSSEATLTVNLPAKIWTQPADLKTTNGLTVNLTVGATGAGLLSYQWFFNGQPLAGATGASLGLTNVTPALQGQYGVLVSNLYGVELSRTANLQVLVVPGYLQKPSNNVARVGEAVSFHTVVTGSVPMRIKWSRAASTLYGYDYADQRYTLSPTNPAANVLVTNLHSTMTLSSVQLTDGFYYQCTVTNEAKPVGTSSQLIFLSVVAPPWDTRAVAGSTVTLRAQVGGPSQTYKWRYAGADIAGATNLTLVLTNVTAGRAGQYEFVVTTGAAGNPTPGTRSFPVQLTVTETGSAPEITEQPTNRVVLTNLNTVLLVGAAGTDPLGFQWYRDATNLVANGTNWFLVLTNLQVSNSALYQVVVTNAYGAVTSAPAQVLVGVPPAFTTQPTSLAASSGATVSFAPSVTGTAPIFFQWYRDGTNLVAGATNATLQFDSVTEAQAGAYQLVASNALGAVTSQVATLTFVFAEGLKLELLTSSSASNGQALFRFGAEAGKSYTVQFRDGFDANPWQRYFDVPSAPTNRAVAVTNSGSSPIRFFRVASPQLP